VCDLLIFLHRTVARFTDSFWAMGRDLNAPLANGSFVRRGAVSSEVLSQIPPVHWFLHVIFIPHRRPFHRQLLGHGPRPQRAACQRKFRPPGCGFARGPFIDTAGTLVLAWCIHTAPSPFHRQLLGPGPRPRRAACQRKFRQPERGFVRGVWRRLASALVPAVLRTHGRPLVPARSHGEFFLVFFFF